MPGALHTTISLRFENMMKTYLPAVDSAGFDAAYSKDKVSKIHVAFQSGGCYIFNLSEKHADSADLKKYKMNGALISVLDKALIEADRPNWALNDLVIAFKRGRTPINAFNVRANKEMEANAGSRIVVRGQLLSCAERVFCFQHRTALFMLFVNGDEFRVIRWDRSGCIVTEALNYVETVEGTEKLLHFLYAYSQATPEQRGFDTTATRLLKDSCGWQWMRKVAMAHAQDLDHVDGTDVGSIPDGFTITPTRDAPPSPLFGDNILPLDPNATSGFVDLSSEAAKSHIVPVFRYVRDLFRDSLPANWACYSLKVCGGYYLVGKPVFEPHGPDAWRPFYVGVDQEGATLDILNTAEVSFVPTLIYHEDVGGPGAQETEASEYSSTGTKKPDAFGEQQKNQRPIVPLPSRSKAKASGSGSVTTHQKQRTSASNGPKPPTDATISQSGERSGKRGRSKDTAPVGLKDGSGLRHLTHYRIVVAEVCLPSTAITRGEQLARIIWHCMTAHRDAATDCSLLHRDVSSGNILVLPTVICADPESGQWVVLWLGMLCDWELAKAIPTAVVKSQARQPHRTGTWYYMSVYSLTNPVRPVSIADELESFFHVLLYLAVRLLRTTPIDAALFINKYFASSERDQLNRGSICGALKRAVIRTGMLEWNDIAIRFISKGPDEVTARSSPLNDIISRFLSYFKARYAVLKYEEQIAKSASFAPPLPSLEVVIMAKTRNLNFALMQAKGKRSTAAPSSRAPNIASYPSASIASNAIQKPSDDIYELATALEAHDSILALFDEELSNQSWPQDDYAGDKLKGDYSQDSQRKAKKARRDGQSTGTGPMETIHEDEELPERRHTAA